MSDHAECLLKKLWNDGDIPLNQAIMEKYFTTRDDNGDVAIPGHFVGMWLTQILLEEGWDFMDLTKLSTEEILKLVQKQGLV